MKSRKSIPNWKSAQSDFAESHEKYAFVSGVSDCSCEKAPCVDENYENVLHEFIDSLTRHGQAVDARQIGAQCLEYVNVIFFNIEWLQRERSRVAEEAVELDKNLNHVDEQNIKLRDEVQQVQEITTTMKLENNEVLQNYHRQEDSLRDIQQRNTTSRSILEANNTKTKKELEKLANASSQVEEDVVQKEVQWDKINFYLEKKLHELQGDHEILKTNYELVYNTLRGHRGDRTNDELDITVLEAYYQAEMVMLKHTHESFISELNKLNYQLWNEKFFARSRLDEEIKKHEYYTRWVAALKAENAKYRDELFGLNKEVEALLGAICSNIKNKCYEKVVNDRNICLDIR